MSERNTSRYLLFDDEMRLKGWINRASGEKKSPFSEFHAEEYLPFAFSGIHVISPDVFHSMHNYPSRFPIMDFYLNEAEKHLIQGVVAHNLIIVDVGKIDSLQEVEMIFEKEIKPIYPS